MASQIDRLRFLLEGVERKYHRSGFLPLDPLEFVHRYQDPQDQEVVALVSALLAYGNVKQIKNSLQKLLSTLHSSFSSPSQFVKTLSTDRIGPDFFADWVHRFNTGDDLWILFRLVAESWRRYGSLGAHFLNYWGPTDLTIERALTGFIQDWKSSLVKNFDLSEPAKARIFFLLNSPSDGSTCKRWCLFLRWMGRKDDLDLGLWQERGALSHTFPRLGGLKPSQLVIPMDTHLWKVSKLLKLTQRKTLNWKTALEVTERLRRLDPRDPVRYDFSLCRLGMLKDYQAIGRRSPSL